MSDVQRKENGLVDAASGYLRSARHQPVDWQPWGDEAFARAREEDKPVLLDIGAVWCHWCHVMDRESYEDPRTAEVINEHYIAVKVDRDERPDVDARYQAAVAAISGQGGWPLTAFLTPDGRPFFGGTYFPPGDRHGQPGLPRVLLTMAEAFANRRDEVEESAGSVMLAIEQSESFNGHAEAPDRDLLEKLMAAPVQQFDERNGGFGSQPKFPYPGVLDLLLDTVARHTAISTQAARVADFTLRKMAAGGIYDQLAGGFHRYSVDERWIVPHFEKMSYDNSELLKTYVHAYQVSGEEDDALIARDIIRWMDDWLSDRDLGGFYASQDADLSLEDDGDYFTWTRAEAAAALSAEELEVTTLFYNLRAIGDMHHNPQKNVLHRALAAEEIAAQQNREVSVVRALLAAAKAKLYQARLQKPTPYIDKTLYTGWNAMCISAYLIAGRVLHLPEATTFALKSLDRVLGSAWNGEVGLAHVVAYGEGLAAVHRISGVLDDYAALANALLDAWETSGREEYYIAAVEITEAMLQRFSDIDADSDAKDGISRGFFDTERDPAAIGALRATRKPIQDSPTPCGNAMAATVLLRLHALSGDDLYRKRAIETLETFAGVVEHLGLYAAAYGLALRRAIEQPVQICIIGDDSIAESMLAVALKAYALERSVIHLRPAQMSTLPPALAETLLNLPWEQGTVAIVCKGTHCLPPISSAEKLNEFLV